jgi:hypothetical protein
LRGSARGGAAVTPEQVRALAARAVQVAMEAPERFNKYGSTTYVRRTLVREIREICDAAGLDWRVMHEQRKAERRAKVQP